VNLALVVALTQVGDFVPSADTLLGNAKWFITLAIVWLASAVFFDCYSLSRAANAISSVRNSALAVVAMSIAYIMIPFLTPPLTTRGVIFTSAASRWCSSRSGGLRTRGSLCSPGFSGARSLSERARGPCNGGGYAGCAA
jgi:hypothetical protein